MDSSCSSASNITGDDDSCRGAPADGHDSATCTRRTFSSQNQSNATTRIPEEQSAPLLSSNMPRNAAVPSSPPVRQYGNKRVALLQTLVLLSMTLLQQKLLLGTGAAAAQASSTPPTATLLETVNEDEEEGPLLEEVSLGEDNRKNELRDENVKQEDSSPSSPSSFVAVESTSYLDSTERIFESSSASDNNSQDVGSDNNDIIIIATVDGTLAGLSKGNGKILWKRSRNDKQIHDKKHQQHKDHQYHPHDRRGGGGGGGDSSSHWDPANRVDEEAAVRAVLGPLVSTTTTSAKKPSSEDWRTLAVPSIDGSVYLTAAASDPNSLLTYSKQHDDDNNNNVDVTVTTAVADLVARAPFVDARGRVYTASTHATAFRINAASGQVLTVASADMQTPNPFEKDDSNNNNDNNQQSAQRCVWLGRVDSSVSVHEPRSGRLDVRFSSSRIVGLRDMMLGSSGSHYYTCGQVQPRRGGGKSFTEQSNEFLSSSTSSSFSSSNPPSSSTTRPFLALVATPNGNLAYRNPTTGQIAWVADECFETPVAFAIDAASGSSLGVDIVPDAVMQNGSIDYVTREMERQVLQLEGPPLYDTASVDNSHDVNDEHTIVGSLLSGELFAVPLAGRRQQQQQRSGFYYGGGGHNNINTAHRHTTAPTMASTTTASSSSSAQTNPHFKSFHVSSQLAASSSASSHADVYHKHSGGASAVLGNKKKGCHAGSPYFPGCLVEPGEAEDAYQLFQESRNVQNGAVVPFYHPDFGYIPPKHYYTLKDGSSSKSHRRYKKMLGILGSWLPPTIALIFVVSFELGRRKRQKDSQDRLELESNELNSQFQNGSQNHMTNVGVIQVFDDVILGYGGHGTIVYKGTLEGRSVAVKRMLRTYHASADREISLLIESDGHPNVVRYFLKEVRGDFVYLALELCDLSLHDLIASLRNKCNAADKDSSEKENVSPSLVSAATKNILFQIASGVRHLHHLRIVHRDLKPMNILLADARKKSKRTGNESVFDIFNQGDYVAKISDMGLGKQLIEQSSYGASLAGEASHCGPSNGAQSSIFGPGPGSVGWQAPEVMAQRVQSDVSVRSEGSSAFDCLEASPVDHAANVRTSRSSDVFSLGCIFYSTLLPGCHPFGEWYEREANIMHNRPNMDAMEGLSPDAYDIVSSMLERNQNARPTAKQVCEHPFFWPPDRRLAFLCDFSDRLESMEAANAEGEARSSSFATKSLAIERNASKVVGHAWDCVLDNELVSNVQRFRTYDPSSVRDLLRLIRNKHHHFDELPNDIKLSMGSNTGGLLMYFEARFPRLLIHCFNVCREILPLGDPLSTKYSISPSAKYQTRGRLDIQVSTITEGTEASSIEPLVDENPIVLSEELIEKEHNGVDTSSYSNNLDVVVVEPDTLLTPKDDPTETVASQMKDQRSGPESPGVFESNESSLDRSLDDVSSVHAPIVGDLVIWEGSTAAKTFNCRGWSRSDDEWERRTDAALRKRDSSLVRCAEDPRFRTRLCNHWDTTQGTFCPMLKKKKCIFAHGPVELRVKEGKRNRWGKLVDKNGDNNNPNHSGGEDTYGAARSIESERKQEGKWNTDKAQQQKGKKNTKKKKSTPSS